MRFKSHTTIRERSDLKLIENLKHKVYGVWFACYFTHGWGRIGLIFSLSITLYSTVSIALLSTGFTVKSIWDILTVIGFTLLFGLLIGSVVSVFGYWDWGKKGAKWITYSQELKSNPVLLAIFETILENGGQVNNDKSRKMLVWIKSNREKFGDLEKILQ